MAGIDVSFSGEYKSYKPEREKELIKKFEDALKTGGFMIERDAKQAAPRDTSRLIGSISTNWTGSGMNRGKVENPAGANDGVSQPSGKEFVVVVGTNVEYAAAQEFGTSNIPAHPYLFPALEKNRQRIIECLK